MANATRTFHYDKVTLSVTAFPTQAQIVLPFLATRIIISNDSNTNGIKFSFLAPNVDGELFTNDAPIIFDEITVGKIWLARISAGGVNPSVRVWAWRK